jgi:MFS transporter, NNP family, nitrate/nitrite transporter
LVVDNVFAQYFFDHFGLSATTAGDLAGSFGMFNIFSRASGGFISDFFGRRYGMRSRLWTHWTVQTLAGAPLPMLI